MQLYDTHFSFVNNVLYNATEETPLKRPNIAVLRIVMETWCSSGIRVCLTELQ